MFVPDLLQVDRLGIGLADASSEFEGIVLRDFKAKGSLYLYL